MALEGKIVDFGVADILQLISQQQKTGLLIVEMQGERVEVLFWNGMIISANPVSEVERDYVEMKLLKAGLVSEQQMRRALEIQEEKFKHLGEILVDMGILDKEVLSEIIHNQIYDTFSSLFQWKEGNYAFHPREIAFNENIFLPLGLEHIILDVLRMIDEWPDIVKKITSFGNVVTKADRSLSEEKENGTIQDNMSHDQKITYAMIGGKNSIQDIIDKSLIGRFATTKSLVHLLDAGYINVLPKEKDVTVDRKKNKYKLGERFIVTANAGILASIVLLLIFLSPPDIKSTFTIFLDDPETRVFSYLDHTRLLKIKNALQIYFWEKGSYPSQLEELVKTRILYKDEIKNNNGVKYHYKSKGSTYQLSK
jgi:hypothetical protein